MRCSRDLLSRIAAGYFLMTNVAGARRIFAHIFLSTLLVVLFAESISATTWLPCNIAELVARSDIVVVGRVDTIADGLGILSEEVLSGPALSIVPIHPIIDIVHDLKMDAGDQGVFILTKADDRYGAKHPSCVQPRRKLDDIRTVVDMFLTPERYLSTKAHPPTTDFIFVLGHLLSGETTYAAGRRVTLAPPTGSDSLGRQAGIDYIAACLEAKDRELLRYSISALTKMHAWEAVDSVLPYVFHEDRFLSFTAIEYLCLSNQVEALNGLCAAIYALTIEEGRENEMIASSIVFELQRVSKPATDILPCLEFAAAQGYSPWAVGRLGTTESFERMLLALETNPTDCYFIVDALNTLVRRSNLAVEGWMHESSSTQASMTARIPKWREWWNTHGVEFRVEKSYEEIESRGKRIPNR